MLSKTDVDLEKWNVLTQKEELQPVMKASEKRPQLIYKHSHTCSICYTAKKEIESSFAAIQERADMNFVNVIKARPVSDRLAKELDVRHESPQVLIIYKEKCIWHESHWSIKADAILKALSEVELSAG